MNFINGLLPPNKIRCPQCHRGHRAEALTASVYANCQTSNGNLSTVTPATPDPVRRKGTLRHILNY